MSNQSISQLINQIELLLRKKMCFLIDNRNFITQYSSPSLALALQYHAITEYIILQLFIAKVLYIITFHIIHHIIFFSFRNASSTSYTVGGNIISATTTENSMEAPLRTKNRATI